jgi:CPA2 family monovalent cation:H+ antiporter-2
MTHHTALVLTLTGGLGVALVLGLVTQRLRLSPIVGYLVAGVAVGPFTPGFVADAGAAQQLAELGVILLMFGVGLHFHPKDLFAVRRVAIPGAIVQIAVATGLTVVIARAVGWGLAAGVVLGLAVSVASTVVLIRVLSDNDALHTRAGHVAVGWLVVEDLFTVLVLLLLPVVAGSQGADALDVALGVGLALLKIAALVAFTLIVGQRLIPKLLGYIARTRSRELFTLSVLSIALGIAVGSAELFGVSMAIGAFLGGMVVGQSEFSLRAAAEALPMRDAFAVLFFVAMGMLLDPAALFDNVPLLLGVLAVILVGKPFAALLVVLALRRPVHTGLVVSAALAQVGEFSFILATFAISLGVLPESGMQVLVAASVISVTLNPLVFRAAAALSRWLTARGLAGGKGKPAAPPPGEAEHRTIVVGYGPVGRTLTRLLREQGIQPTVLELNHETVRRLTSEGVRALHGDASQSGVLEGAGVTTADSLIFTASGSPTAVIAAARELNPRLLVLARSTYIAESGALLAAGAEVVCSEAEVALAMTERLLARLGATDEQLARERDRVRAELACAAPASTPASTPASAPARASAPPQA